MGHAIERFAISRGHNIVARIDKDNRADFDSVGFLSADVAIEFSTPSTAVANYLECFKRGIKVVSGTTGWTSAMPQIKAMCENGKNTFFWASNFSLGVNIFFALNRYLSTMMERAADDGDNRSPYAAEITEVHHIHKLDHPSGTAITIAEGIGHTNRFYNRGWGEEEQSLQDRQVLIRHRREGEVPGTHIVKWHSPVDEIIIEHKAHSRDGFALGAVKAAEWVNIHTGFLTMPQMMAHIIDF